MQMETALLRQVLSSLQSSCRQELALLQVRLPMIDTIPVLNFHEAKEMIAGRYQP